MFVHHEGLVVAYTWNREKQMFVALRKEFDMENTKQKRNKLKIQKKKKNVLTFGNRTWINRTVVYYIYHCTIHTIMLNEVLNYMLNPISQ